MQVPDLLLKVAEIVVVTSHHYVFIFLWLLPLAIFGDQYVIVLNQTQLHHQLFIALLHLRVLVSHNLRLLSQLIYLLILVKQLFVKLLELVVLVFVFVLQRLLFLL